MWPSPLGMVLPDGSRASHRSARDYVRIPAEALRPAGGELWLQITEELWESAYLDRVHLLAVDHTEGTELVVDERIDPEREGLAPPLFWIERRLRPVAAVDHAGRDVLEAIIGRDGRHVDNLPLSRYQGLTLGHSLELSFEAIPASGSTRLILWGWNFPTDTSINFALAQDSSRSPRPPSLELRGADGGWRTLYDSIGFPNGKRKAMVLDLTGLVPPGEVTLRISSSMQVYWDAAVLAVGERHLKPLLTRLEPSDAELHYRGYSRLYRETATGPHLFDYESVSHGPRFRDMAGSFTRFGPVGELLTETDDRYVVMNAGDELTIRFSAARLPELAGGWRRDWVLYTDGWVKDGDLNTAFSQTVAPLPYHGMAAYPDQPAHRYPDDPAHREFLERYQTREVTAGPFRDALRASPGR